MAILSKLECSLLHLNSCMLNRAVRVQIVVSTSQKSKWSSSQDIHSTSVQEYPVAQELPLPDNVEINSTEKSRFSPERYRDFSGSFLSSINNKVNTNKNFIQTSNDPRVASYDCSGAVSLNSSMQTNVPQPFRNEGDVTNLNMPGGQWAQDHKYLSEELNNSHPTNTKKSFVSSANHTLSCKNKYNSIILSTKVYGAGMNNLLHNFSNMNHVNLYSTLCRSTDKVESKWLVISRQCSSGEVTLSKKEKLKRAVKEYGATVIIFHVTISLISLGGFYLAVTSGLDFSSFIGKWGPSEGAQAASTAAPFVVAYAIHKIFAPVRISITLASTPFIVRHLRKIGVLKPPAIKHKNVDK